MRIVLQRNTSVVVEMSKVPKNFFDAGGRTEHHWYMNEATEGDNGIYELMLTSNNNGLRVGKGFEKYEVDKYRVRLFIPSWL